MGYHICGLPGDMVIQVANSHGIINDGCGVHHSIHGMLSFNSHDRTDQEMVEYYIESHKARPKIICEIFKDNSGVIEMTHMPKL